MAFSRRELKVIKEWLAREVEEVQRELQDENAKVLRAMERQVDWFARRQFDRGRGLRCKYCGSTNLVRYGTYKDTRVYRCKDCGQTFNDRAGIPHMQSSAAKVGAALGAFYRGMSLKQVGDYLEQHCGRGCSKSTALRWLRRFTDIAVEAADEQVPNVGPVWVADETVLRIGGRNVWFWDIIDARTRFLLASRSSTTRGTRDAFLLMHRAAFRAGGGIPQIVLTDKLAAYLDGVEFAFGGETKHIRSKGFQVRLNTNLMERFHGTLKDRTKVMRGLGNLESAKLLLRGWLVQCNFFRPHESLWGRTPAEAAGIQFEYGGWLDVMKGQQYPSKMEEGHEQVETSEQAYRCRSPSKRVQRKTARARSRRAVSPSLSVVRM